MDFLGKPQCSRNVNESRWNAMQLMGAVLLKAKCFQR